MINFRMSSYFQKHFPFPFDNPFGMFAPYMDIGAFCLTILATMILAIGVKESSRMNNICTTVNLSSVASKREERCYSYDFYFLVIVISGLFKANTDNWHISIDKIKISANITTAGRGGFMPYSFSGVLSGAATCFYAFVGFDLVATTGEETENPRMAIPVSICIVLFVCCIVYCAVAAVLTLMIPYYSIRVDASLPDAFDRVGLSQVKIASKNYVKDISEQLVTLVFKLQSHLEQLRVLLPVLLGLYFRYLVFYILWRLTAFYFQSLEKFPTNLVLRFILLLSVVFLLLSCH